jgi:hypothetical protein
MHDFSCSGAESVVSLSYFSPAQPAGPTIIGDSLSLTLTHRPEIVSVSVREESTVSAHTCTCSVLSV